MRRTIATTVFVGLALLPGLAFGQGGADAGSTGSPAGDAGAEAGASTPKNLAASQFTSLVGTSWGARHGCVGSWRGVWQVSSEGFSLLTGSTEGASSRAFHAVCTQYRGLGPYAGPKVGVTLFGGVIRAVAIIPTRSSERARSKFEAYFSGHCEGPRSASGGTPYAKVYESCGGYDVGLPEGDDDIAIHFFVDESAFRGRMNSLPMPTKPDKEEEE